MSQNAMKFPYDAPRMTPEVDQRVHDLLQAGCYCGHVFASLTRRRISNYMTAQLQCLGCGHSIGSALPKAGVIAFYELPEWDEQLRESYDQERRAAAAASLRNYDTRIETRRAEYREWLRTSPQWADMRRRVLERDRYVCQGCLTHRATDVHHGTYDLGRLPPAFYLHSMCRTCHDRVHGLWDEVVA